MSANPSFDFHALQVRSVRPDTPEAVIVSFELPPALREAFAFTQGQYLTLRAQIDGQDLRRSYSICAGVDDGELRVGVRRVRGGVFSNWIHGSLRAGDRIQVMVPQGRFFTPIEPAARRHHVGIAGGSGITPILSIMKTVLAREPRSRFTLIYANRQIASTMFKEELEDLKNRHLARLTLHHVFSEEQTDVPLNHGVMGREKLGEFLQALVPARGIDQAYICGPFQMNDEAEAALQAAGVPAERIHIERFGIAQAAVNAATATSVAGIATVARGSAAAPAGPQAAGTNPPHGGAGIANNANNAITARVVLVRDGLTREIALSPAQPDILTAAAAAGIELPFSCTSGVCGTCRARLLEGEVDMARNFALDARELAAGFVLVCQARPRSARVVLSFDAR
jgi:ring-1,2-phenylacetyl-CoA epoxidase subunit PaaE